MSKKFLTSLDMTGNQIINLRAENLSTLPASTNSGRVAWNTTDNLLYVDDGTTWNPIGVSADVNWEDILGRPTEFPPTAHTHVISDVTGLSASLTGKADVGHTHTVSDITDLPTTLSGYSLVGHTHTIANVTGLQTALDDKAPLSHTHTIANVTGLQTELDGKANATHTHVSADITDLSVTIQNEVISFWDSTAGTDDDLDTIRETLDKIRELETDVAGLIGRFNTNVGDGTSTSIDVTHALNSLDITVEVYEIASGETVICDITRTSENVVTLGFGVAPAIDELRVVIKA